MLVRWLEKNGLSALKLTLMDVLGTSATPHGGKDVPLLDRNVSAKVFNSIFPLAHVSNGNEVTLINPNGVDLKSYEKKLKHQVELYWDRLTKLAWDAIPLEKRDSVLAECGSVAEGVIDPLTLAYRDHRDVLQNAMEDLGWPRTKANFDLLEAEIEQAENLVKCSASLREEAGRLQSSKDTGEGQRLMSHSLAQMQNDGKLSRS